MALADAGGHKVRAQHAGTDLVADQLQVLVKGFSQRHHSMLADVVDAHIGRRQQTRHAGGVDDVALISRICFGSLQHHGREQAHTMHDTPKVDAEHPLPVGHRIFPDQSACAHACVVEHQVRGAKTRLHIGSQLFHGLGIGDIQLTCQHLNTLGLHFNFSFVQCVLLHV